MEKKINLNAFIVPNSIVNGRDVFDWVFDSNAQKCAAIGIDATRDEDFVDVWIHDTENRVDNCTDHGYDKVVADMLELGDDRYNLFAPNRLPVRVFDNIVEGDSKTFVTKNGVAVTIKFEQLPYRYGRYGRIEEVIKRLKAAR